MSLLAAAVGGFKGNPTWQLKDKAIGLLGARNPGAGSAKPLLPQIHAFSNPPSALHSAGGGRKE